MTDLDQSLHNMEACRVLESKSPKYVDWEITIVFYAAFWIVREYCGGKGVKLPHNHGDAVRLLKVEFKDLHDPYKQLLALSWIARYEGRSELGASSKKLAMACYDRIVSLTRP